VKRAVQRGMTLVELMVAMTIGLLVTIVAVGALVMGRTGYSAVESTSHMLDNERLAVDVLTRLLVQAGYQDLAAPQLATRAVAAALGQDPEPDLFGWNNAAYTQPTSLAMTGITEIQDGNRPSKCGSVTDTSCLNGSDVLVVRFQGTNAGDESMINCQGTSQPGLSTGSLDERALNLLFVDRDAAGEPALYCAQYDRATAAWTSRQVIVPGVESMQLLFGVDNVSANTVPAAGGQDTIVDRWLRADQVKVSGNSVATKENWRRVRAVRVGLVLRGPVGSAVQRTTSTVNPLGPAFASADDTGSALAVAADGRLRRAANFTVHVRNDLSTRP
jgi:type IV pilus assembly protein PilW